MSKRPLEIGSTAMGGDHLHGLAHAMRVHTKMGYQLTYHDTVTLTFGGFPKSDSVVQTSQDQYAETNLGYGTCTGRMRHAFGK